MARRRRWILTLLAPVVGLGVAEVYVRYQFADEVDSDLLRRQPVPLQLAPMTRPSSDPVLIYELTPSADQVHGGVRVQTDADGLRVGRSPPPVGERDSRSALRVAAIGASTTFGLRVPFEHAYPQLFAEDLQRFLGRDVDLRVFAVPGYNATQQARLFESRVMPWAPNLVIWHYDHRDAFPALGPDAPLPMSPEFGDNWLRSSLVKLLLRRRHAERIAVARFDGSPHELFETYIVEGEHYDNHVNSLLHVGNRTRTASIPVVFVLFDAFLRRAPAFSDPHQARLHQPLLRRLRPAGFHILDLAPRYLEEMRGRDWKDLREWWLSLEPLDGHPNEPGHRWLAQEVLSFVRDRPELASGLTTAHSED